MANITYAPGIEFVQGALAKPKKVNGHKCGDYLIGTHRTAETTNPNCTRIYLRKEDAYTRNAPVGAAELAARNRFKAIAQAVAARRADLAKVTQDQQAFRAQKDQPGGKKTMRSYLWKICAAEIGG